MKDLLEEVVSGYRARKYEHLAHVVPCGYCWTGGEPAPTQAVCCNDDRKDFLLWTLRPAGGGSDLGVFPLGTGVERLQLPIIGHLKTRDPSLTSVGRFPGRSVELREPDVPADYETQMLRMAGFPATPANLHATREMMRQQFLIKAYEFIASEDPRYADVFVADHASPDLQAIVRDLGRWNPEVLPYIQDLPWRIRALMLEPQIRRLSPFWTGLEP